MTEDSFVFVFLFIACIIIFGGFIWGYENLKHKLKDCATLTTKEICFDKYIK